MKKFVNVPTLSYRPLLLILVLLALFLTSVCPHAWAAPKKRLSSYKQPAYITNAYFSDKMAEQGNVIQPLAVVKALLTRPSGAVGYLILDLMLTQGGSHHFRVDILDESGKQMTDLTYAPVQVPSDGSLPLYTAAGSLSGDFNRGLWFFKVYDRLNKGDWDHLGTFAIMVIDHKPKAMPKPKQKK